MGNEQSDRSGSRESDSSGGGSNQQSSSGGGSNHQSSSGGGSNQQSSSGGSDKQSSGGKRDAPLDNNSTWRAVSDKLDKALGDDRKESKIRGTAHAAYHEAMAWKNDNPREHERAKDQWNTAWGGSTDNLKKYDEAKKQDPKN